MSQIKRALLVGLVLLWASAALATASPNRIVAIGSDIVEILIALGAADRIVATDSSAAQLAGMQSVPKVGYMRSVSAEGILAQGPNLVLLSATSGPPDVLTQLRDAGLRLTKMSDVRSPHELVEKIRQIAALIGRDRDGEALAQTVAQGFAEVAADVAGEPLDGSALIILGGRPGLTLAGGHGTPADTVLALAGIRNAFSATGYKALSAEGALASEPDLIIVPSHILSIAGGLDALFANPTIALTRAGRERRMVVVDSPSLFNFGPRLPDALSQIRVAMRKVIADGRR